MPPKEPKPGLVFQYGYLFHDDARHGQEHGKDRPCLIRAVRDDPERGTMAYILPITTTPQWDRSRCLEIPATTAERLGLDTSRQSYLILDEWNATEWPCPEAVDVPAGRGHPKREAYGYVPGDMFRDAQQRVAELAREGQSKPLDRGPPLRSPRTV